MARPKKNLGSGGAYKLFSVPGQLDVITETDVLWEVLLKRFAKVSRIYGFSRVEPGLLEDIQTYKNLCYDKDSVEFSILKLEALGRTFALRPAMLPSVIRTYFQHKVFESQPLSKWSYSGVVVRPGDKKQLISELEFGFEVFGTFTHLTEAQVIAAAWDMLTSLGLPEVILEINNIGDSECQSVYEDTLKGFLKEKKFQLCDTCNEHLAARALSVFRCSELSCQAVTSEAPTILDFLDTTSQKHFTNILEALDELQIPYQLNPLYAGPDGTSKTNVVIKYKNGQKFCILGEAGYHDDVMQMIGGKNLCCFGFAGNLTRIREALAGLEMEVQREKFNEVFLVPLGDLAAKKSLRLFRDLTSANVSVYDHFGTAGVKNQLKAAEIHKSPIALIMGQKEAVDDTVILRDVKSGMQEVFSYDKIVEEVKKRLGK